MAYTGTSIVDYLKSTGQASDFASRTKIAQQQGISNYAGTAQQNLQLLGQLNKPISVSAPKITPTVQQPIQPQKTTLSPQQLQNLKINNQQQQAQKQQTTQTTQPAQPKQQTTTQPTSPTQPTTKVATQPTQQPSFEDYVKQQTGKTTQELNTLNGSQAVIDITKAYNAQYPATQQQAPQTSTYQVKSGDTLSAIARANNISIDEISGYRSGDPNLIYPGEQLTIKKYTPPEIKEAGTTAKIDAGTGATAIIPPDDPTNKYNTDTGELNPKYEAPLTETQKGYAGFLAEQMQASLYEQIKKELGVPDNKTKIAESSKALQVIQDEKSDKLVDINSNPWLSDNQRLASLRRLDAKFDARIKNAEEQLDREQKLYDNSVKEAQWKSKLMVDQYNEDREFAYQAKKDAASLAQQPETTGLKEQLLEAQIGATRALELQRLGKTGGGISGDDKLFTQTQINKGASQLGLTLDTFNSLSYEAKNILINQPKQIDAMKEIIGRVSTGKSKLENVTADITNSNLPYDLKSLFIQRATSLAPKTQEQSFWDKVKNFFIK